MCFTGTLSILHYSVRCHLAPSAASSLRASKPKTSIVATSLQCLQVEAKVVVGNLDPFRLRDLVGAERFGPELNQRLDAMRRPGTTMKVAGPASRAGRSREHWHACWYTIMEIASPSISVCTADDGYTLCRLQDAGGAA